MSTFKVEVVPVKLEKHPDADRLSIATVRGWNCVVNSEGFEGVSLGAYIPIDAIVPKHDDRDEDLEDDELPTGRFSFVYGHWVDLINKEINEPILDEEGNQKREWRWKSKNGRVKTAILRGVISQGLLIPALSHWKEGDDVKDELRIKKYEPIEPVSMSGDLAKHVEGFRKYTDIENIKNYMGIFVDGEEVTIREKVNGSNGRVGLIEGQYVVGSHNQCKKPEGENIYSKVCRELNMEDKIRNIIPEMEKYFGQINMVEVFGEVYGGSVQKGWSYGLKKPDFMVFDIFVGCRWLNDDELMFWVDKMGLKIVPEIYRGPFNYQEVSRICNIKESILDSKTIREGGVIRPIKERHDMRLGRVILKRISEEYEIAKSKRKDFTDYH